MFSLSGSGSGDIAQLVEQMTFNHWVQGSSPCVPTRINRRWRFYFLSALLYRLYPNYSNQIKTWPAGGVPVGRVVEIVLNRTSSAGARVSIALFTARADGYCASVDADVTSVTRFDTRSISDTSGNSGLFFIKSGAVESVCFQSAWGDVSF